MPIYDFRCQTCGAHVALRISYSDYDTTQPICPQCGQATLVRRITAVRVAKSTEQRLDKLADFSRFADVDENDPRAMGRMLREMAAEAGEDLGGEFGAVVERLEAGDAPEAIEADLAASGMLDDAPPPPPPPPSAIPDD